MFFLFCNTIKVGLDEHKAAVAKIKADLEGKLEAERARVAELVKSSAALKQKLAEAIQSHTASSALAAEKVIRGFDMTCVFETLYFCLYRFPHRLLNCMLFCGICCKGENSGVPAGSC